MLIDATHAEETRVVVVDGNKVEEFDFESENKRQLAGNIYLAKVTRVEPSLQAAFVDYGGNRHGFLAFSEIHPDYYQIPVADREALMEEERAYAEAQRARDEEDDRKAASRAAARVKAEEARSKDPVETLDVASEIRGMETIDLDGEDSDDAEDFASMEAVSPMERVAETPVEEPADGDAPEAADADQDREQPAEAEDGADEDTGSKRGSSRSKSSRSGSSRRSSAAEKDDSIEAVADEDDVEDIRPARKPRPRRYKI